MSIRTFSVAAAVTVAACVALSPPAVAAKDKEDPKAAQDAVRKEYKDAKKYPTLDLTYFVDTPKMKDTRWTFSDPGPPPDQYQGAMLVADFPSGNESDPAPSIHLVFLKCAFGKREGNATAPFQKEFKSWGKSVLLSNPEMIAQGYYEDFIRECTDPIKEKSKVSAKANGLGPAKYWGYAVGTDKELKKRVRKDWFVWTSQDKTLGAFTWTAEATTSEKFVDDEERNQKLQELMKNVKELADKRLK